ncbi:MAG: LemA family protein [Rikenellaceae bacterium]
MKKNFLMLVVAIVTLCSMSSCSTYNNMVNLDEGVAQAWANVETQYQRRADLIPNLVNTVKGYAQHEQQTLTDVIAARSAATSITIDTDNLTSESMATYQKAQGEVTSALGRLLAVSERYPDLKANQNFVELQAQLEGTENRIAVARGEFNRLTREYNSAIRRFPANIIANHFEFEKKPYFEASSEAATAPTVAF